MKYAIGRPVNGIVLNPLEFACNPDGSMMRFDTENDLMTFLREHMGEEDLQNALDDGAIRICKIPLDTITVTVKNGRVESVATMMSLDDVTVEVHDYDVECTDAIELKEDETGAKYFCDTPEVHVLTRGTYD